MCIFHHSFITVFQNKPGLVMGFPSPAADHSDKPLNLHEYLIVNPPATYFWRYGGASMDRAGILTGALLIVDRSLKAQPGDIVGVYHLGECLVLRLKKQGKRLLLTTEPLDEKNTCFEVVDDTILWGVVTHVINGLKPGAIRPGRYADLSDGQG